MQYHNVCLEAIAYTLPDQRVTSAQIEQWLAPLYRRLGLPEGRLELMTGIRERRFWEPGTMPGQKSAQTAEKAIRQAGIDKGLVGALVHGSVSRDYLEPATACGVHRQLDLPDECVVYDVSNACLGLLNGVIQVANMIELGQIRAGLVVGTESSRALVETTIRRLNNDTSLGRNDVKPAFASLTIGSASAAIVLVDGELSRTGNRLSGGVVRSKTEFCDLCRGVESGDWRTESRESRAESGEDLPPHLSTPNSQLSTRNSPLMETDSEALMREGVRTAQHAFVEFLGTLGWQPGQIHKTFCHQVGRAHQKLLFESLGLDAAIDYSTLEFLGNTGSAALPVTAALGIENGRLEKNDRVALLGIGSGINVIMLGVDWQRSPLVRRDTSYCQIAGG